MTGPREVEFRRAEAQHLARGECPLGGRLGAQWLTMAGGRRERRWLCAPCDCAGGYADAEVGPLFILAPTLAMAAAAARERGLPSSPNTPLWTFLTESRQLRGRSHLRVLRVYGGEAWGADARRWAELDWELRGLAKSRPGSVVEV